MSKFFISILLISLSSCALFDGFSKRRFTYNADGAGQSKELLIPSGYSRMERLDTFGISGQFYHYKDGAFIYFVYTKDTAVTLQPINYENNIPKQFFNGLFFKGVDSAGHYWRESRFEHFRLGYKNVDAGSDWRFDSSLNYFQLRKNQ